jgi:hypothetical protein
MPKDGTTASLNGQPATYNSKGGRFGWSFRPAAGGPSLRVTDPRTIDELNQQVADKVTDVVFLRELDGDDIFAVFPAHAACAGRTDLMVCYASVGQHGSASDDYCDECDEVTDPADYADLLVELQFNGYELYVISKDRMNDSKYADSRALEDRFGNVTARRSNL